MMHYQLHRQSQLYSLGLERGRGAYSSGVILYQQLKDLTIDQSGFQMKELWYLLGIRSPVKLWVAYFLQ